MYRELFSVACHLSVGNVFYLYQFSGERRHTFLHSLRIFNVGETYMELRLHVILQRHKIYKHN